MRPIDADALMKQLVRAHLTYENGEEGLGYTTVCFGSVIRNAPTIDAEPVRHGHWIDDGVWDVCFVCGRAFLKVHLNGNPTFNYCPNCGAKTDEEAEHE